jgi:alpha-tubulin suppressor-like RCC1 family protein
MLLLAALLTPMVTAAPARADQEFGVPGPTRADAASIAVGRGFACVIVADGSIRCWGENDLGELAQGNTSDIGDNPGEVPVRVDLGAGRTAAALTAGRRFACALLDGGQVRCWGQGDDGQMATGDFHDVGDEPHESTVPIDLGPGRTAVAISAGWWHACALLDTGQVRCWGQGDSGQLANGTGNDVGDDHGETTVAVDLGGQPAVAIATGQRSSCATLATGQLRCWGENLEGQLLQGNTDPVGLDPGPRTVALNLGGHTPLAVTAGGAHICAILDDHTLRCWGASWKGQLGLGRTEPFGDNVGEATLVGRVDLPAGRTPIAVSAGDLHTCVVLDDGELRCFGDNAHGELGQGNTTTIGDDPGESTVPVDVGAPIRAVAAGDSLTCALTASGVRCFGANESGQLGQGSIIGYGANAGETPAHLPPVNLGGQSVGRDTDGDGVRDAVDTCPTVAGTMNNGCATPPAPAPEATLKGTKIVLDTVLTKTKASAKCPPKTKVTVRTKTAKGKVSVTKQLKSKAAVGGCRVKGKVKLPAKPKKTAKVKVTVSGKKLRTKHLVAVRP